ncbi:MAG TPA: prefoldin subunit [Candidatus Pacearchaeota archaeon]|nr:prefoldin subunit [Candidatus Pacearchaeota archaeon]
MINSDKNIQEIQFLEQNLQNILFQKQAFQIELSESKESLNALENSSDEVFKTIGQLMIKYEKSKIKDELLNKIKILELRIKTLEKQESTFSEKMEKLRDDFLKEKENSKK